MKKPAWVAGFFIGEGGLGVGGHSKLMLRYARPPTWRLDSSKRASTYPRDACCTRRVSDRVRGAPRSWPFQVPA